MKKIKLKKNEYLSKDVLKPLIEQGLSIPSIAKQLNVSIFKVKMSLINADIFVGKKYAFKCEGCSKEFYHFINGLKFCSNSCKHAHQEIWNRNKTKYDDERIMNSSISKIGNKIGLNSEKLEKFYLKSLDIEIEYNPKSYEKDFLLTLNNKKGLTGVERFNGEIEYYLNGKKRRHKPDYVISWESGVVWIVEIKGNLSILDIEKCNAARKFADANGFQYRIYTKGFIKYDIWNRFYTHLSYFNIPSKEFIMMNNAIAWSMASCSLSRRVGCVISNKDCSKILAMGFNGDESGGSNVSECLQPGESGWIHAEENALVKLGDIQDGVLFITDSPCEMCAKKIINSKKIKEVYYLREYRDLMGVGKLILAGINVYKFIFLDAKGDSLSDDKAFDILKPGGFDMVCKKLT